MNCLYILLLFLPFTFGDILEPCAAPVKRYNIVSNISFSDWPTEEKPTLVCNLICQHEEQSQMDFWVCKWRTDKVPCYNVTQEIMRNAETIDPRIPYLINASSSTTFGIWFHGKFLNVSSFQDGFLLDYPHLYAFAGSYLPIKKIGKKMFEGIRGIKFLQIDHCPFLSKIEPGSFQDMTSLEKLNLGYNRNLSRIEKSWFKGLGSLKYLSLRNNLISRIEKNMFKELDSLTDLSLQFNSISRIEANTFTHLHSLRYIDLHSNGISYIHKDAFTGFKGCHLDIGWNWLSSSDLNSVRNLTGLYMLFAEGNYIRSVPGDILQNLPYLYRVYLYYNPISSLPTGIFNYSNKLIEIWVGCGQYKYPQFSTNLTLEKESFATKSHLGQILIDGCVTDIEQSAFKGLNASVLALQYNSKIKKIKRNFFEGMLHLSELSIVDSGVEIVEYDSFHDPSFKNLNTLVLVRNKLTTIEPHTFLYLTQLTTLYLSENYITEITQNVFDGLHTLTNLYLNYNNISKIDGNVFSPLDSLELLDLSHNHIKTLSGISFKGLEVLSHLDFSYNEIDKMFSHDLEYFGQGGRLKTLLLQGNNIMLIECPYGTLRLELLNLSQNQLTNLSIFSSGDIQSNKIVLSKNKLTMIDSTDVRSSKATELLLDHNKIRDVDFINAIPNVNHLDLRYNLIEEVNIQQIACLKKIATLRLEGNPWKCSCRERDRPLMIFLLECHIISCCPIDCICDKIDAKSVNVYCHSKNKSSLPTCLPFENTKMDYSNNLLTTLTFTSFHENVTHLDLNQNLLTWINGSSFTLLKNLSYLDLRENTLKKVPHQFERLKATKIYLEGNIFFCNDCNVMNTLEAVDQVTPQYFNCKGNQTFQRASFICLMKFTIAPYASLFVGIVALISGLYLFFSMLYMTRLSKRYEHKFVLLHSKKDTQAYKNECEVLQDLDHRNIRKLYKNMITWIPKRVGHLYYEKMDCSLRNAFQDISSGSCYESLNVHELTRQLMAGIQFLHSQDNSICIINLNINSIFLQLDNATNSWILKLGDFSQVIVHAPTQVEDEEAPLTTTSDQGRCRNAGMQEDLQAAAHVVYFMLTHREKEEPITMQDLKDEPDVEMSILILSLQNGMTATEALLTAPFQLTEQRVLNLGELNAIFKGLKKTKDKILGKAEENACLVIGGKGAWNKYFHLSLLEEFALLFNGYNITSYICLLRIIRNILQHGPEIPSSMLAAFNTETPTPEEILLVFSIWFPFFYLHSIYCLYRFFDKKNSSGSDIFMTTYQIFEKYICDHGLSTGDILPLQEKSSISIHYKAPCKVLQETIFVEGIRSCVYLKDILPQIYEKSQNLWPDVSLKELYFKRHDKVVLNLACSTDLSDSIDGTSNFRIPEGSSLQVLKPEVTIQLPDQVVVKRFKKTDNVKSLKGFSTKFLPPALRNKEIIKSIILTFDDKQLKDGQRILDLDFADHAFIVRIS